MELELSNRMLAFCSTNNRKTATERGACPAPFPFGYDAQPDAHAKKAHKSVRLSCIRLIFAVCCDIIFFVRKQRLFSEIKALFARGCAGLWLCRNPKQHAARRFGTKRPRVRILTLRPIRLKSDDFSRIFCARGKIRDK